jgi:hypothetical protein
MARSFFETAVQDTQLLPAARSQVFDSLLEWNAYPEWNPYITRIEGKALPGQSIQVFFFMGLGPRMPLTCRVDQLDTQNTRLAWEYKAFLPWLYTARHVFALEDTHTGHCRIVQTEYIKGLIACPLFGFFHSLLRRRFQSMHAALLDRLQRTAA